MEAYLSCLRDREIGQDKRDSDRGDLIMSGCVLVFTISKNYNKKKLRQLVIRLFGLDCVGEDEKGLYVLSFRLL